MSSCRAINPATCRVHGVSHYAVLNVGLDSSQEEIGRAFRRNARLHHPDTGGSVQQFQKFQLAFSVLSVPSKRVSYDLELKSAEDAQLRTVRKSYYENLDKYYELADELNFLIEKQERCKTLLASLREKHKADPKDSKVMWWITNCMSEYRRFEAEANDVNARLNAIKSENLN